MKQTILAGTLALVTGCSPLYDIITFGSSEEPQLSSEERSALQHAQQARENGRDLGEEVSLSARISLARLLVGDSTDSIFAVECVAREMGNDPLAAYCFSVAKEGAAVAHGVRRTAFPDEYYRTIARQAEDAATIVREDFLRFLIENFGTERRRRNLDRFGLEFYHGWYHLLFWEEHP